MPEDMFAPTLANGKTTPSILILTADKVQDLELYYPYYRLVEAGYHVEIATPDGGTLKPEAGMKLEHTLKISDITPDHYDLLYIPGGKAPAALKKHDDAIAFVKNFAETGKPIAAFCHGPQVLAEAELIAGKNLTGWPEIEKEITKAGGRYHNKPLVEDGQFITARWPGDLPGYMQAVMGRLG